MRACILWLGQQPWRWNARSVWSMVRAQPARARAYLTQLVSLRVLVVEDDTFQPGPAWSNWSSQFTTSLPGGNSREYRRAAAERAENYRQQHEERQRLGAWLRAKRGQRSVASVARAAQVSHSVLFDLEAGRTTVKAETLARITQALEDGCREN
jgi:hypothetical protein